MCEKLDSKIAINDMHEWAHWITPEFEKYRYDTYFFLTTISYHSSISVAHDRSPFLSYNEKYCKYLNRIYINILLIMI